VPLGVAGAPVVSAGLLFGGHVHGHLVPARAVVEQFVPPRCQRRGRAQVICLRVAVGGNRRVERDVGRRRRALDDRPQPVVERSDLRPQPGAAPLLLAVACPFAHPRARVETTQTSAMVVRLRMSLRITGLLLRRLHRHARSDAHTGKKRVAWRTGSGACPWSCVTRSPSAATRMPVGTAWLVSSSRSGRTRRRRADRSTASQRSTQHIASPARHLRRTPRRQARVTPACGPAARPPRGSAPN
jgi:hypothetical protein